MTNRPEETAIKCRGLNFRYDKKKPPLLNNVSFEIEKGEVVVLMGPSGCGKSTLAYCLAGLYPEYAGMLEGEIHVGDTPIGSLSPSLRARRISIMFQNPDNQFCMGRVDHEVMFSLENINYTGDMQARMHELLQMVGLLEMEKSPIHQLSGGMKQKVALATALATGAEVLVLDEPFANVDPNACLELAEKLKELNRTGITLFIVDHRLKYWRSFLTRVMLMDTGGRINEANISPDNLDKYKTIFHERGLFFDREWYKDITPPPSPAKTTENNIELENLSVSYGSKKVLSAVSLTVQKGSVVALTGDNGSGKSTLLWAIAGLKRNRGHLNVTGKVGLVFQNPRAQFLTLKVREEILLTLKSLGVVDEKEETANALLDEFGLLTYADTSPYTLSQGQQRRLAILTIIAGKRPILLLDEPTYAQDEQATRFILELLREHVSNGLTVIFATHDHELAHYYANRVLTLENGGIAKDKWIN